MDAEVVVAVGKGGAWCGEGSGVPGVHVGGEVEVGGGSDGLSNEGTVGQWGGEEDGGREREVFHWLVRWGPRKSVQWFSRVSPMHNAHVRTFGFGAARKLRSGEALML